MIEITSDEEYLKGRGAQINPDNPFHSQLKGEKVYLDKTDERAHVAQRYIETHPKTLVNKVESPDIGLEWSMNPYQGCEHGCVFCYARNTHTYWGYSAGLDFESIILVKKNAPELLGKKLRSRNWKGAPIMLSGNTDCYQPIEKKLGITRQLLEILWEHKNPVGLITKNQLITRDIDILAQMAEHQLVKVAISLNTLQEDLRQKLEPRTATIKRRLETIKELSTAGIPVNVMVAPVIPGLNNHEILPIMEKVSEMGAMDANYIVVRLNGDVARIFEDWIEKNFPDRASKVLGQIAALHGGKENDSEFGKRMKGVGEFAAVIKEQHALGKRKYLSGKQMPAYNRDMYMRYKQPQLSLFS